MNITIEMLKEGMYFSFTAVKDDFFFYCDNKTLGFSSSGKMSRLAISFPMKAKFIHRNTIDNDLIEILILSGSYKDSIVWVNNSELELMSLSEDETLMLLLSQ